MSRSQVPSSSASSGRAGLGDDSDLRSQLFAPQRKVTQHNLVSREAPLAAAAGSPAHPAGSAVAKSSSPAVKTPAVAQVTPVVAANTSGAVLSPAVDSSDACGASMESLLEELNRRKTHNALLKKALLQEKEKAAAAELKVKQMSLELHRKNEEQDVLVFNNTRLVRRVEALQEEIQAAAESVAPSSNWQWSWISGSPSQPKQPDPLQQAKLEIAALQSELATKIEENELTHMKVFEERRIVELQMKDQAVAAQQSALTIQQLQAEISHLHAQLHAETDKCLQLQQQGESLSMQATAATAAAAASEERATCAEQRLQGVIDEMNARWRIKWKAKMPLDLPEVSSPLDVPPGVPCDASSSISARALLVSELRRTFSFFALFLNAFRDRAVAAANGGDAHIKAQSKFGYGCGMKLLIQCTKEHSKVMETVVGSVSRLVNCVAILVGDAQSQSQPETDLLQSLVDSSSSVSIALHKWSSFANELSACMLMLIHEGSADSHVDSRSGVPSSSAAIRCLNVLHRSLASLSSISQEIGGPALLRSGMSVHSFQVVARAALEQVVQSWHRFCDHFAVFFRSESCSTTIPPALKLLSLRLNSILDDCCRSIEQLKVHAAASFSFQASSSIVKFSSPSISQFVRLACGTAAMTARMFATAVPPSVPHATAAKSVQTLVRMKAQLVEARSVIDQLQRRVSSTESQLHLLKRQPPHRSLVDEKLSNEAGSNTMPIPVSKLQGRENVLFSYLSQNEDEIKGFAASGGGSDDEDAYGNENTSWLDLDCSGTRAMHKTVTGSFTRSHQFELEVRQHLYDLLQYIDDLERQVLSSQSSISMLSKPCSICSARSRSQCENEGKSDSSRSSSRRGSSSIQGSSGDGSRRSSVLPHLHGGNADQSSVPLFTAQHSSPVSASPDKPSISGHTIIAASLRLFSRRNVATQSSGHITQAGENLVASNSDSLQVVVSVKDRTGRPLELQSLKDRDAVLKQFFSSKIANVQRQSDEANVSLGLLAVELSETRAQLQKAIEEVNCARGDVTQFRRLFEEEELKNVRLKEQVAMLSQQVVLLAEKLQQIDNERKSRRAAAKS